MALCLAQPGLPGLPGNLGMLGRPGIPGRFRAPTLLGAFPSRLGKHVPGGVNDKG